MTVAAAPPSATATRTISIAQALNEALKSLTKREIEILRLVAEGLTNEENGKKVFISEKTVKTHLTNIFDKLKVNNRFKAALLIMGRTEVRASAASAGRRSP